MPTEVHHSDRDRLPMRGIFASADSDIYQFRTTLRPLERHRGSSAQCAKSEAPGSVGIARYCRRTMVAWEFHALSSKRRHSPQLVDRFATLPMRRRHVTRWDDAYRAPCPRLRIDAGAGRVQLCGFV